MTRQDHDRQHDPGREQPRPDTGALVSRYAELRSVPEARRIMIARSAMLDALRRALLDSGHIEVDTPLLQVSRPATGRSFRTETRSLDPHTYLRSSPLYLRAMLTTGFDRVFEIGRCFRDEPVDATHSPEYSLIELYQADTDYRSMRTMAQDLVRTAAVAALGDTTVRTRSGRPIDLAADWTVTTVHDALSAATDQKITPGTGVAQLREIAHQRQVATGADAAADEVLLDLYDQLVEPATVTPTFYTDFPASLSPLAQTCPYDARLAQKWDLVIDGREIATSYTELTDVDELRHRLSPSPDMALSPEANTLDEDWLIVFAAGMPPAGGLCIGLERLVLTLTDARTIRDAIPFPLPPTTA